MHLCCRLQLCNVLTFPDSPTPATGHPRPILDVSCHPYPQQLGKRPRPPPRDAIKSCLDVPSENAIDDPNEPTIVIRVSDESEKVSGIEIIGTGISPSQVDEIRDSLEYTP